MKESKIYEAEITSGLLIALLLCNMHAPFEAWPSFKTEWNEQVWGYYTTLSSAYECNGLGT